MVLSKEDCNNKIKETFDSCFNSIEGTIDNRLKHGNRNIPTSLIYGVLHYHDTKFKDDFLAFVINKYKQAGWNIRRESGNDRDGHWDYLEFS